MPETAFPVTSIDGVAVITTPEEIDISNAAELRAALLTAATAGASVVVVDMSGTEFCDSTGLNTLVRAQKQAAAEGGQIKLIVRTPAVQRMLTMTGVANMFGVYASLREALDPAAPGTS
jgi:anti-sigma B factor antagonist